VAVLIVDDSSATRDSLRTLLEAKGYRDVKVAASGGEVLGLLGADRPPAARAGVEMMAPGAPAVDVILMDVEMPGMDGIEACRRIKAVPHLRDIPILIVTGLPDEYLLEAAFEAGACDYITKPVYGPELLARLRSAMNLKREVDNLKAREAELLQATEQLRRLNEELERLAILDELTGVANRRFFNLMLHQEWGRAAREVHPLSLVMVDIDHFKGFNDHYGHQQGDECLRQVAGALGSVTKRYGDQVARYGGEEFAVLMPHTGLAGATAVAERLRQRVEALGVEHAGSPSSDVVTISLGVAAGIPGRRTSADSLVAAADSALYEAKRSGRNQVKVYDGLLEEVPPPVRVSPSQPASV
jgi:diguanylate cyclase (GGDEF)-like protein